MFENKKKMFENKKEFAEFIKNISDDNNTYTRFLDLLEYLTIDDIKDSNKLISKIEKSIAMDGTMLRLASEKIININKKLDDDSLTNEQFFLLAGKKEDYESKRKYFNENIFLLNQFLKHLKHKIYCDDVDEKFFADDKSKIKINKNLKKKAHNRKEILLQDFANMFVKNISKFNRKYTAGNIAKYLTVSSSTVRRKMKMKNFIKIIDSKFDEIHKELRNTDENEPDYRETNKQKNNLEHFMMHYKRSEILPELNEDTYIKQKVMVFSDVPEWKLKNY